MSLAEHTTRVFAFSKAESPLRKHTILMGKLNTSVTLEDDFWNGLKQLATERGVSIGALMCQINAGRSVHSNLSSAARVYLLRHYQERGAQPQ